VTGRRGERRQAWGRALRCAAAAFAVCWLGWGLLSAVGVGLVSPGKPVSVPGWPAPGLSYGWHNFFTGGYRQDALWYLRIATHGYRSGDGSAAFFPLYPLLIRLFDLVPGLGPLGAATLVAQGGFLASLVLAYRLAELEFDEAVARTGVVLLACFPSAFFFLSPYTEGPFLALCLGSFYCARRGRWAAAGSLAALATLTRSVGLVLVGALAAEALQQWREGRRPWAGLAAALGPPVGIGGYLGYWWLRFGDAAAPWQAQRNWQRVATFPLLTLYRAAVDAYRYDSYWLIDFAVVLTVILAMLAGLRVLRWSYLTYGFASLLLPLCDPFPSRPLMSMPRFCLLIFPAVWVVARGLRRRGWPTALAAGPFAAGYALLGLLFMNWLPIF
jgi:hypothetical protein